MRYLFEYNSYNDGITKRIKHNGIEGIYKIIDIAKYGNFELSGIFDNDDDESIGCIEYQLKGAILTHKIGEDDEVLIQVRNKDFKETDFIIPFMKMVTETIEKRYWFGYQLCVEWAGAEETEAQWFAVWDRRKEIVNLRKE